MGTPVSQTAHVTQAALLQDGGEVGFWRRHRRRRSESRKIHGWRRRRVRARRASRRYRGPSGSTSFQAIFSSRQAINVPAPMERTDLPAMVRVWMGTQRSCPSLSRSSYRTSCSLRSALTWSMLSINAPSRLSRSGSQAQMLEVSSFEDAEAEVAGEHRVLRLGSCLRLFAATPWSIPPDWETCRCARIVSLRPSEPCRERQGGSGSCTKINRRAQESSTFCRQTPDAVVPEPAKKSRTKSSPRETALTRYFSNPSGFG